MIEEVRGSVIAQGFQDAASMIEHHLTTKGLHITKLILEGSGNISKPREYYFIADVV